MGDQDRSIISHISELVGEERQLRAQHVGQGLSEAERDRLRAVEEELDQYWDLLRQRRAKAEYGEDPDTVEPRPAEEVESYLQ